ncbi:excisionase family DNA-binding protein [Candidatus Contubernalis alkaliaceticus]|uniref:excisionase family DNA-binding protein n=1 Tax=Candidatus Contubernalis alkaliaceticus TaxID=338645 RepID=UPI001F4BD3FC|nr:excisionase family DNA-binding protein [Candidatus Contubernalis alkalaceticus]UNC92418.1 excisionase family DNA-binding protein [Candidatus Contubernalis alkalaceticus]
MVKEVLTVKDAASYMLSSTWKVYMMVKAGELPHFRVGGKILFRKETLDQWMAEQEKKSVNV